MKTDDFSNNIVRKTDPRDVMVGGNVKKRRLVLGYSQMYVAEKLGLTFQQIQKYEYGKSRIGASRLVAFAETLHCHPGDFFKDMVPESTIDHYLRSLPSENDMKVIHAFNAIVDRSQRNAILNLMRTMAQAED